MSSNMRTTRKPAYGLPERAQIGVSALQGIGVLFEDDLYELAQWLLKLETARNRGTNNKSRHTVYGLAGVYATAAHLSRELVVRVLERHGLPLDATIEYNADVTPIQRRIA